MNIETENIKQKPKSERVNTESKKLKDQETATLTLVCPKAQKQATAPWLKLQEK